MPIYVHDVHDVVHGGRPNDEIDELFIIQEFEFKVNI
jgi:hypothetical protein